MRGFTTQRLGIMLLGPTRKSGPGITQAGRAIMSEPEPPGHDPSMIMSPSGRWPGGPAAST